MKASLKTISLFVSAALFTFTSLSAVETQPVGYTTLNIAAGTGAARTVTVLGLPLYAPANNIDGSSVGVITSVTSNTISVSGAGWTDGQLSVAATPYIVRITSGNAEGRNLLISANTIDTLTINTTASNVSDLTTLGITASTDKYELVECDTLSSLFGEPVEGGIVGGADSTTADVIFMFVGGSWSRVYYDTDVSYWTKVTFGSPNFSNQVIMPDAGLLYSRLSNTSSDFVITGTVPNTARSLTINKSGVTPVANAWPTNITLLESEIQNAPNWVASSDSSVADKVFVFDGSWSRYYHDGTNWRKITFGTPISDSTVISSGSAVLISKTSADLNDSTLTQSVPYTL